jgi:hypothetical protein
MLRSLANLQHACFRGLAVNRSGYPRIVDASGDRAGARQRSDRANAWALAGAILADLRKKDRPGVRVIAAAHGVSVNTVQRIAHAQ